MWNFSLNYFESERYLICSELFQELISYYVEYGQYISFHIWLSHHRRQKSFTDRKQEHRS